MDPTEDHDDDRTVPPKVESYSALRTRILKEARGEERSAPSEDATIMLSLGVQLKALRNYRLDKSKT
jgi:hypothetical protein